MDLREVFTANSIVLGHGSRDGNQVLMKIAETAAANSLLAGIPASTVFSALKEREALGSTALGNGVAIPHCRLDGAEGFTAGILTTVREIGFGAPDGKGVRIFPFVIGPTQDPRGHLELLSALSRLLRNRKNRERILHSRNPGELLEMTEGFDRGINAILPDIGSNLRMIHVFVGCREAFNDVMDVFASGDHTAAMIIEAERADSCLASIPVFAGFWNTGKERFGRIIVTVVHEKLANQLLRKLEFSCGGAESENILVTVTDVQQAMGNLQPGSC